MGFSNTVLFIWQYIKPQRRRFYFVIFLSLLTALLSTFSLALFVPIIKILFSSLSGNTDVSDMTGSSKFSVLIDFALALKNLHGQHIALVVMSFVMAVLFALKNGVIVLQMRSIIPLRLRMIRDIRNTLFNKIVHAPVSQLRNLNTKDIASVITSDVAEFDRSVATNFENIVVQPLLIVGYSILLFAVHLQLSMFLFCIFPVLFLWFGHQSKGHPKNITKTQKRLSTVHMFIAETLQSIRTVKTQSFEEQSSQSFQHINEIHSRSRFITRFRKQSTSAVSEMATMLLLFAGVVLISFGLEFGLIAVSPAELTVFAIVFTRLVVPLKHLANSYMDIRAGQGIVARFQPILNLLQEDVQTGSPVDSIARIQAQQLKAGHNSAADSLFDINVSFVKGNMYALAGASGSGKTTFIDCLLGIRPLTSGSVLVNDNDLSSYSLQSIRQQIAYVGQSAELFTGSVLRNIDMANKHERLHVEHILHLVGLNTNRIADLGLSTKIGENGNAFSGGEGQRLLIARALLSKTPVLIFDEATSAVDPETELRIMQYLQTSKDERICILISHRLQTISYADSVLVLDKGVIAERGTFAELSVEGTRFSKLFNVL